MNDPLSRQELVNLLRETNAQLEKTRRAGHRWDSADRAIGLPAASLGIVTGLLTPVGQIFPTVFGAVSGAAGCLGAVYAGLEPRSRAGAAQDRATKLALLVQMIDGELDASADRPDQAVDPEVSMKICLLKAEIKGMPRRRPRFKK